MRTLEPTPTTFDEQSELLPAIDAALEQVVGRGLMAAVEVVDLLLDLRSRVVLEAALGSTTQTKQDDGRKPRWRGRSE
jgi:hypothetical protein